MDVHLTRLANGLRVVTHRLAHMETVSLGVWVGSGARSEKREQNGLSHLLEHMAFKGTRRRSARQIAEEIESAGGDLNAATGLETTAYYARVLKGDVALALDILGDILQNSTFEQSELDRERRVILQEIAAASDIPDDLVYERALVAAFPEQPAGRPILGTPESIAGLNREALNTHVARHYGAANMVLSAAGALDHETVVRHAEAQFGALNPGRGSSMDAARYRGGAKVTSGPFEQSHIIVGFEGPSYLSDDIYGAQVLSGLFGGGMSSRLFQKAREMRALCYSIYSYCWSMRDSGFFGIQAATGADQVDELLEVVVTEFEDLADNGPRADELARSKAQIRAGLAMSLESSGARAEQMARQLLAHGRLQPMEELLDKVESVDCSEIRALVARFLERCEPTWSEIVPEDATSGRDGFFERLGRGPVHRELGSAR